MTTAIPIVQQQQQQIVQNKYVAPPILDHSGSRKRQDPLDTEYAVESYVKISCSGQNVVNNYFFFVESVAEKQKKSAKVCVISQ